MLIPSMRPPFTLTVPFSREEAIRRLSEGFAVSACPCRGSTASGHVTVMICDRERKLFSPTLDLEIEDRGEGGAAGAVLEGRFGPHPHLWTLYVAMYAVLTFLLIGGLVLGMAQQALGQSAAPMLTVPLALVLGVGLYGSALVGQRLAAHQMATLDAFLRDNLGLDKGGLRSAL